MFANIKNGALQSLKYFPFDMWEHKNVSSVRFILLSVKFSTQVNDKFAKRHAKVQIRSVIGKSDSPILSRGVLYSRTVRPL